MAATFMQAMVEAYGAIADVPELWGEQVGDTQTEYPRAELNHGGEVPTYSSDGVVEHIDAYASIVIYDTALASVDNLCKDVKDGLPADALDINGQDNRLWRKNYTLGKSQERTADQLPIFMGVIDFHCEITGDY